MGMLEPSRGSPDSSPPVSLALRQDRVRLLLWFSSLVAPLVGISFEACGRTWGKLGQPYFNLYVPHTRNCLSIAHGILRATYAPNIGIDLPGNKLLVAQSRNSTSRRPQRPALSGPTKSRLHKSIEKFCTTSICFLSYPFHKSSCQQQFLN